MRPLNTRRDIALGALAVIVLSVFLFVDEAFLMPPRAQTSAPTPAANSSVPPPSSAVLVQLAHSKGFSAFVSITDAGFEPSSVTLKKDETIRFTNNSHTDVWIAQITSANTPANPQLASCDVPFNSCKVLHPGDFMEFNFPASGTYHYMNNLSVTTQGTVVVQ